MRQFDKALTTHTQAVAVYRQLGDHHGEGRALNNLGATLADASQSEKAIIAHIQAADIFHHLSDRHGEGQALGNLGLALVEVRRYEEARDHWGRAARAFADSGDVASVSSICRLLAELPPMTDDG